LRLNLYQVSSFHARIEDISAEGRMLIMQGSNHSSMMPLGGKSREPIDPQFPWTTSADLSADGKTLLYYNWGYEGSDPSDVKAVYLRELDGSKPIRLGPGKPLALSPDGKWALALQTTTQPQLVMLSTSGAAPRILPNRGIKEYSYASFFPDGRQVLFTGIEAREGADIRSFVQDVDTGEVRPLTEESTFALLVSPDGKNVVTSQPDQTYYIQPLAGGEPTEIPGLERGDEPIQWSDDGLALYVKGGGEFATKIYRVNIASGKRRQWKDIDPANKVGLVGLEVDRGGILITPDGKVCVYTYWTLLQSILTKRTD
jgi:Tol biopolymer transport system component